MSCFFCSILFLGFLSSRPVGKFNTPRVVGTASGSLGSVRVSLAVGRSGLCPLLVWPLSGLGGPAAGHFPLFRALLVFFGLGFSFILFGLHSSDGCSASSQCSFLFELVFFVKTTPHKTIFAV